MVIGLLAIPPVIAAMSASLPETGVVGAFCLALAVLSILWHQNLDVAEYVVSLLIVIAGYLAGLWVASLRVNLNREQAASELLAEAGALMEDALDRRERAQHLADLAIPSLGDVALIDMVTPEGSIERMAAQGRSAEVVELFVKLRANTPIDPHGPHPVAEVIRTGRTKYLDRLSDQEIDGITTRENERELLRKHRFKSCIVLPLGARGSVLGAITLWIMRPTKAFDATARRTAKRLADRAALALDNARLHEQQAHIASVLQHSLLPRSLPEIKGFESSSRFLAAGEAYEVGGDFYDVFRSGAGSWTAVIGDVCGKGPEAASLTALARYTVRTASSPDSPPSQVLRTLHDSISSERADLRFCTAAGSDRAALQRIRHGPYHRRTRGPPAAPRAAKERPGRLDRRTRHIARRASYGRPGDTEGDLGVGDTLVLYTDGVLDVGDRSKSDDPGWLIRELPDSPARAPTRSPRASPRRRSSATAESRATTSPCSSCTATAARGPPSAARAGSIPTGAELFYPKGVPQRAWLSFYAEHFDTVEINNTFYRLPSAPRRRGLGRSESRRVLLRGEDEPVHHPHQAADDARPKASGRFYEPLEPLTEPGAWPPALAVPGELPSRRRAARRRARSPTPGATRLRVQARQLVHRRGLRAVRKHGAALVIGDESSRWVKTPHVRTADWTYIRFHHGSRGRHGNYSASEIETWARRIAHVAPGNRGLRVLQQRLAGLRAPQCPRAEGASGRLAAPPLPADQLAEAPAAPRAELRSAPLGRRAAAPRRPSRWSAGPLVRRCGRPRGRRRSAARRSGPR